MRDVYIVSAVRTAIGRFGGSLESFTSSQLGSIVIKEAVRRAGVEGSWIDEVIMGNVYQAGGKGNPARQAAIMAGLPLEIPAMTINKQCASGLRSITLAYQQIIAGEAELIVAGGTESMSNVPHLILNSRQGTKMGDMQVVDSLLYDGLHCAIEGCHMGITAENLAVQYRIPREEQDRFALESQRKAREAIEQGIFATEIVPVTVSKGKETFIFEVDEHPRQTSLEKLGALKPVFKREDGTVTAGNASGINDGAAAVIVASGDAVEKWGLKPLAKIRSVASAAVDPSIMGIGPVPATLKALAKINLTIDDIDLFEINEAFAAQTLAVLQDLKIPEEKVNIYGGAIALGHPVGCSGARIVVTLLNALQRKDKTLGVATLCVGGGQGTTMIVERV